MNRWLEHLEPRVLSVALAGALVITLTGAYIGLFKRPLQDFQRLQRLQGDSVRSLAGGPGEVDAAQLATAGARVDALRERLYGKGGDRGAGHTVARIIARLDGLSSRRGVELIGVTPGARAKVGAFNEAPFDVEASGAYFDLVAWLEDAEDELRPLTVTRFEIGDGADAKRLRLRVRVVSYRAAGHG